MTDRIIRQMIRLNIINSEEEEIYRFGLNGLELKILHYLSYLFIAAIMGEMIPFFVFFIAFLFLRKNAGGFHASTKKGCYLCSCATVFAVLICIKTVPVWNYVMLIHLAFLLLADILIYEVAPLGNRNRVLDEEETYFFRKQTIVILSLENAIVFALLLTEKMNYITPIVLAAIVEAGLLSAEKIRMKKINRNGN